MQAFPDPLLSTAPSSSQSRKQCQVSALSGMLQDSSLFLQQQSILKAECLPCLCTLRAGS